MILAIEDFGIFLPNKTLISDSLPSSLDLPIQLLVLLLQPISLNKNAISYMVY